MHRSG
ncbi:hypothetical protein YPPY46_2842, partial [Yersinia pestis PY-46]